MEKDVAFFKRTERSERKRTWGPTLPATVPWKKAALKCEILELGATTIWHNIESVNIFSQNHSTLSSMYSKINSNMCCWLLNQLCF